MGGLLLLALVVLFFAIVALVFLVLLLDRSRPSADAADEHDRAENS